MSDDTEPPIELSEIRTSLTAESKLRYYGRPMLERKIRGQEGACFESLKDEDAYLLRTHRPEGERIVIVFSIDESGVLTVITQTSDHYDWNARKHLPFPYQSEYPPESKVENAKED